MGKLSLEKILQSQGLGSRKHCRALIGAGLVSIAEQVRDDSDEQFETDGLVFTIDGQEWSFHRQLYIALNKPEGYECSRKPSRYPGVLSLLPEAWVQRDVQPVGRLDQDTTGLLLLSDDGQFIHTQSSPKHHVPKTYQATLARPGDAALVRQLLDGVQLHDEPAPLRALRCDLIDEHRLVMSIEQGKYHQVKRMLAAAGNHCAALTRIAIGRLRLENLGLAPGGYILLSPEQLELSRSADG